MSYMNFDFGLMTFEDTNYNNPTVRSVDIKRNMAGVPVASERTDRIDALRVGESRAIASTARVLTQDNTTFYVISRPDSTNESVVRLVWDGSGTSPGFATKRSIGTSAATTVTVSRVNPATSRVSGLPNAAAVQVGDTLRIESSTDLFESVFSPINRNKFQVLAVGTNHVDVLDNGVMSAESVVLGPDYDEQVRCYREVVKVGDILEIGGSGQNPNNVGKYEVVDVSVDYVQFLNPYAANAAFQNTNNVVVYDKLIGFVCIRASGVVSVSVNGGAYVKLQRIGSNEALFIASLQAHSIELKNEEQADVSVIIHYSSFV